MYQERSDYRISGVFDDKELAQKFVDTFSREYYDMGIEEWELNPYRIELGKNYKPYSLTMDKDGNSFDIEVNASAYIGETLWRRDGKMVFGCLAKDQKHAIKIANEKRTQLIANNKWGEK